MEIALSAGYAALFVFLISRMSFFRELGVSVRWIQGAFVLKVLSGVFLYLIYTRYYTDRSTADIFKYFDDSAILFNAAFENPGDFLRMITGVGNDSTYFNDTYYSVMNHWNRSYGVAMSNDTHSIIRFNALARFFSLGYYNVHSVILNFLSLIGLSGILIFLKRLVPNHSRMLFLVVFLLPGVMFWGSGVLKEGLLFFGLGMLLYSFTRFISEDGKLQEGGYWWGGVLVTAMFFLTTVKPYALLGIFPGILALRLNQLFRPGGWKTVIGVYVGGVILVAVGQLVGINALQKLVDKQTDFIALAEGGTYIETASQDTLYIPSYYYGTLELNEQKSSGIVTSPVNAVNYRVKDSENPDSLLLASSSEFTVLLDYGNAGSRIEIAKLEPSIFSFIKTAPMAFVNGLMRPFPWNVRSPFMLLALMENLALVVLLALMIFKFSSVNTNWQYCLVAMFFALIIILLTGWVTPVVGAIVRYKVPALPFLCAAFLALTNKTFLDGIESKLSRLG